MPLSPEINTLIAGLCAICRSFSDGRPVVAGGANNQLATAADGDRLHARGILYAPDYVINAGGIINVADELMGYDRDRALARVEGIYHTLREVFRRSETEGIPPMRAADMLAEERMRSVSRVRLVWVPGRDGGTLAR